MQATRIAPTPERLTPRSDRARVDLYLAAYLAESRRRFAGNPRLRPLYDRAAEFVLRGGKRLRPRLSLASYRILAGNAEPPPRPIWLASASLELFHAFMLVHDDLIDGSTTRRGRPTLPVSLRLDRDEPESAATSKRAADLGLVAGDLLCALGMRLIARSGLDESRLSAAHRIVADVLLETGLGEALDILHDGVPLDALDEPQILDAYVRKTARYSVSGPLVLGASLAGASAGVARALRRFGDLLGLGYQLANDLETFGRDPDRDEVSDLDGGKRTWLLWLAYRRLDEPGREALSAALGPGPSTSRRAALWELVHASGALAECRARLEHLGSEAADVLDAAPLEPLQRQEYLSLMGLIPGRRPPSSASSVPMVGLSPLATAGLSDARGATPS